MCVQNYVHPSKCPASHKQPFLSVGQKLKPPGETPDVNRLTTYNTLYFDNTPANSVFLY